jgi:acyl-CoA dehydrogenase
LRKLGLRSEDTATLAFVDCRIPAFNHIDGGLRQTLTAFNESRPMVSAFALGVTRAGLDFTGRHWPKQA